MGNARFADSEWPEFVEEPWWAVLILCGKPINRRDVDPDARVTHQVAVLHPWESKLRAAVIRAQELADNHREQFSTHEPRCVVQWSTKCLYGDGQLLVADGRDELWEVIAEHVDTPRHAAGVEDHKLLAQINALLT